MSESMTLWCKMCKVFRYHFDIGIWGRPKWKCIVCGEYNKPKEDE